MSQLPELIFQASNLVRSGNLNLDISYHCNVAGNPKWIVSISHVALSDETIRECGALEKCLSDVIDRALQRWNIPKMNAQ